jgi:hypothetical protein
MHRVPSRSRIEIQATMYHMVWHPSPDDPAQRWLRESVRMTAATL